MNTINIKPMTINQAWQGRRYKTPKYKAWREQVNWMLPATVDVPEGRLMLMVTFGTSSKLMDLDNLLKPFIDALQDKYGFNDRQIYAGLCAKVNVPKRQEFIKWELRSMAAYDDFMKVLGEI